MKQFSVTLEADFVSFPIKIAGPKRQIKLVSAPRPSRSRPSSPSSPRPPTTTPAGATATREATQTGPRPPATPPGAPDVGAPATSLTGPQSSSGCQVLCHAGVPQFGTLRPVLVLHDPGGAAGAECPVGCIYAPLAGPRGRDPADRSGVRLEPTMPRK